MITVKELFDKNNVPCPDWLRYENLNEEWKESEYIFDEEQHIWSLITPMKHLEVRYDGETYTLIVFDPDGTPFISKQLTQFDAYVY